MRFWLGLVAFAIGPVRQADAAWPDRVYSLAGDWRLERFGQDVAILRAPLAATDPARSDGSIIVSCDGGDARLRIVFPDEVGAGRAQASTGRALLRAFRSGGVAAAFPFTWGDGRILTASGSAPRRRETVARFLALLRAKPASLDALLTWSEDRSVASSVPAHLRLGGHHPDSLTLDSFAATCALGKSGIDASVMRRTR